MEERSKALVAGVALLLVVSAVAVAAAGALGRPSVRVVDAGDWGQVTERRTEVVTALHVDNPTPVGLSVGRVLDVRYRIHLNDVTVARGQSRQIRLQSGTTRLRVRSTVRNERLVPWWVRFVRADETIHLRAEGRATIDAPFVDRSYAFTPVNRTYLSNSTPFMTALERAAASTEGRYTRSLPYAPGPDGETTVGVVVENATASWGRVNRSHTTIRFRFRLHNPSRRVPVPATTDPVRMSVRANGVRLFSKQSASHTTSTISPDDLLRPGETETKTVTMTMPNDRVDEWFASHVRRGERSRVRTTVQLVVRTGPGREPIRIPKDGVHYTCHVQTALFVDDQRTETTCGE